MVDELSKRDLDLPSDPARGCPACSSYSSPAGVLPVLHAVCGDACFKAAVYRGRKVDSSPHALRCFVGDVHAETMTANAPDMPREAEETAPGRCDVRLSCANANKPRSKIFFFQAVMGLVCPHVVPLFGCFAFSTRGGA